MSTGPMSDVTGVSIGRAAALFGLAPSTLRWWESQGVLPEPPRVNGRRVYGETELRRIGLAYLCCVTGAMPLDQATVVTSGSRDRDWHGTVRRHAGEIEERIRRLRSAHTYLLHLLQCPDDDMVAQCTELDGELIRHTPRGHAPPTDLVAAAQSPRAHTTALRERDETSRARDEKPNAGGRCAVCAAPFPRSPRGRRRTYCSRACQQRHYRQRTKQPTA